MDRLIRSGCLLQMREETTRFTRKEGDSFRTPFSLINEEVVSKAKDTLRRKRDAFLRRQTYGFGLWKNWCLFVFALPFTWYVVVTGGVLLLASNYRFDEDDVCLAGSHCDALFLLNSNYFFYTIIFIYLRKRNGCSATLGVNLDILVCLPSAGVRMKKGKLIENTVKRQEWPNRLQRW